MCCLCFSGLDTELDSDEDGISFRAAYSLVNVYNSSLVEGIKSFSPQHHYSSQFCGLPRHLIRTSVYETVLLSIISYLLYCWLHYDFPREVACQGDTMTQRLAKTVTVSSIRAPGGFLYGCMW